MGEKLRSVLVFLGVTWLEIRAVFFFFFVCAGLFSVLWGGD